MAPLTPLLYHLFRYLLFILLIGSVLLLWPSISNHFQNRKYTPELIMELFLDPSRTHLYLQTLTFMSSLNSHFLSYQFSLRCRQSMILSVKINRSPLALILRLLSLTHRHFYELLQPALRKAIRLSPYNPSAPEVQNPFMDVYPRFLNTRPAHAITNHYRSIIQTRRQSACIELTTQLNATLSRYSALRSDVTHLYDGLRLMLRDNSFSDKASCRTYRAILSFLAPAFQSILGLATEDQIYQVQDNLLKLQNNQYAINNDTERLYSQVSHLANVTNRRIDVIWSGLAQQAASVKRSMPYILLHLTCPQVWPDSDSS